MTKWYQDNLLIVNCDKCQAVVLENPKEKRNVDPDICDEKVEQLTDGRNKQKACRRLNFMLISDRYYPKRVNY